MDEIAIVGLSVGQGSQQRAPSRPIAPVTLLEELSAAGTPGSAAAELASLVRDDSAPGGTVARGVFVIATCNRLELYVETSRPVEQIRTLVSEWCRLRRGLAPDEFLYHFSGADAVRHLLTVASGLDSVVLGENEILHQIRNALHTAQDGAYVSHGLQRLAERALSTGKRVRTVTSINADGRSLATAGIDRLQERLGSLRGRRALIIGAGAMAAVVASSLRAAGLTTVDIANRTPERAHRLAMSGNGQALHLDEVTGHIADVDVVVGAAAGSGTLLKSADVAQAQALRPERPLLLLDLALPRNIDAAARHVEGVVLIDLQDLAADADTDEAKTLNRPDSVVWAERLVADATVAFMETYRSHAATATITAMRAAALAAAQEEEARLLRRLGSVDDATRTEIHRAIHRIVNKVLHEPTEAIRARAAGSESATPISPVSAPVAPMSPARAPDAAFAELST